MRNDYGKLLYALMDSVHPQIQQLLGFNCVRDIRTVHGLLEERGALGLLSDDLIIQATKEIIADKSKPRYEIQRDIKRKEAAIEALARRYASDKIGSEEIRQALYSIGDNHAYLTAARRPATRMIEYLKEYFSPDTPEEGFSLSIQAGRGGARISHDHQRQYVYVLQSLSLWQEIAHEMFRLWHLVCSPVSASKENEAAIYFSLPCY
jgi:hypothetical protein